MAVAPSPLFDQPVSLCRLPRKSVLPSPLLALETTSFPSPAPASTAYFNVYPKPPTTSNRPSRPEAHQPAANFQRSEQPDRPSTEPAYVFPTYDETDDLGTSSTPKCYSRVRSRTGPSGESHAPPSTIPALRFSGSSSTQHTDTTPPQTPVDFLASQDSLDHFPLVAAPVAGVETMDALVDGMNGGDDILLHVSRISNRTRFSDIPGHHPLYQPPLPTPPPGVVLGGGKSRRSKTPRRLSHSSDSDSGPDRSAPATSRRQRRRRRRQPEPCVTPSPLSTPLLSTSTSTPSASEPCTPTSISPPHKAGTERSPTLVPSIADIIRAHAPLEAQLRTTPPTVRSSFYAASQGHGSVVYEEPESITLEELDLVSRSSMDSIADEVQQTLRTQLKTSPRPPPAPAPPSSFPFFPKRHSTISDNGSIYSPRSDPGVGSSSLYSFSLTSSCSRPPALEAKSWNSMPLGKPPSISQEVAEYLRSARLTTLLRLTRSPHASQDNPLTVSLSDLGSSNGYPVIIFLGLGCVRHLMGLYDEMAEIMNLRLITIDRWGLGRTEARSKSAKGIIQWASVVEEVLDLLQIEECSVIAHSAGAPYALSFANKASRRIRGDVCLLAPWVGGTESNGYKWLKYVPNSILKTAQAAEWKVQAWMLGKPPTIAYEGIENHAPPPIPKPSSDEETSPTRSNLDVHTLESMPRPSMASSIFSEYDDLRDFDGRFESRSTLGTPGPRTTTKKPVDRSRKSSKGFLNRLKGSSHPSHRPTEERPLHTGRTLKALRSMSSLKGRSSKKPGSTSPQIPPSLHVDVSFGLDEPDWATADSKTLATGDDSSITAPSRRSTASRSPYGSRSGGRRSVSFNSPPARLSLPSTPSPVSPSFNTTNTSFSGNMDAGGTVFQAALGNALIAASHAESARGTHNDLLQILNHENHSWGFSYSSYPHTVKVWYGEKDEKIAENAIRWMARGIGEDRCAVQIIKGADHGLLYRSSVMVEVLEHVLSFWKTGQ